MRDSCGELRAKYSPLCVIGTTVKMSEKRNATTLMLYHLYDFELILDAYGENIKDNLVYRGIFQCGLSQNA